MNPKIHQSVCTWLSIDPDLKCYESTKQRIISKKLLNPFLALMMELASDFSIVTQCLGSMRIVLGLRNHHAMLQPFTEPSMAHATICKSPIMGGRPHPFKGSKMPNTLKALWPFHVKPKMDFNFHRLEK